MSDPNHTASGVAAPSGFGLPGLVKSFFGATAKRFVEVAVGLSVAGLGLVVGLIWTKSESYTHDYVIRTVADELMKDDSKLSKPFQAMMTTLRQTEVGSLNVGSFKLTQGSSSYYLYLYFPNHYSGELNLEVDGLNDAVSAVVQSDTGNRTEITKSDVNPRFDLAKFFAAEARPGFDDPRIHKEKELRCLTFQIDSRDAAAAISVKYAAFIKPVIVLGK